MTMAKTVAELPTELQSVDWQALLTKWGPLLIRLIQLLLVTNDQQPKMGAAGSCGPDCTDTGVCCDAGIEATLAALHFQLQCRKCC